MSGFRQTKLLRYNRPIGLYTYTPAKRFTKQQAINHVKKLQSKLQDKNLDMMVTMMYDQTIGQFRSGKMFSVNDEALFFDPESWEYDRDIDQKNFPAMAVYLIPRGPPRGGDDAKNDCLYKALYVLKGGKLPWRTASLFKKFMKVDRYDPVNLDDLSYVSDKLKSNIYVTGDYTKQFTGSTYTSEIHLDLSNGHYSPCHTIKSAKSYFVHRKRPTLAIQKMSDGNIRTYNGLAVFVTNRKQMIGIKNDGCSPLIIDNPNDDIKKVYDTYMNDAKICSEAVNKALCCKTPYLDLTTCTVTEGALKLFHYLTKSVPNPDEITTMEAQWIENATIGGIIYAKSGEYKDMVSYDINSSYPYIIGKAKLTFPVTAPQFKTITNMDVAKYYPYGIIRAKISGEHPFFRFNKLNYYTHVDLTTARACGLQVNIIDDGEPNAMLYTSKRVIGNNVFGRYVDLLYELKRNKTPIAKQLLTCLWGALCKTKQYTKTTETEVDLSDANILHIVPTDSTMTNDLVRFTKKSESQYQYSFGRIKPFILAFGRSKLMNQINKYRDHIVRIHTDSMVISSNVKVNLDIGTELGQWKIEKRGHVKIHHVNKLEWS